MYLHISDHGSDTSDDSVTVKDEEDLELAQAVLAKVPTREELPPTSPQPPLPANDIDNDADENLFVGNGELVPCLSDGEAEPLDDDTMIIDPAELSPTQRAKFAKGEKSQFGYHAKDTLDVLCYGEKPPVIKNEEEVEDHLHDVSQVEEDDADDQDFEMDESAQLSDGEDDHLGRHCARPKRPPLPQETPTQVPPTEVANEANDFLRELDDSEPEQPSSLDDLKDELAILMIKKKKMERNIKPGQDTSPEYIRQLDEIKTLEEEIHSAAKLKSKRVTNAREYWEKTYGKKQSMLHRFNQRKGPGGEATTGPRGGKRRKGNAGGIVGGQDPEADKSFIAAADENDPVKALAAIGDISFTPGAFVLNDNQRLFKQLATFEKIKPGQSDLKGDRIVLQEAVKSFGSRKCQADKTTGGKITNLKWKLHGMKTSLYNHQIVGVSWMVGRELSPHGPYGGIQSDAMGLGKTLQILACMAANPPTKEDIAVGRIATLIVVPAASMAQWKSEIIRHSNFKPAFIYKGSSAKDTPIEMWKSWDIVLTTYGAVLSAFPSPKALQRLEALRKESGNHQQYIDEYKKQLGDLFRVQFYRIVLDEAHVIKNHESQISKACFNLSSKYRWAVTATPIHNNIQEMFPYFRFIGMECSQTLEGFTSLFGNPAQESHTKRLQATAASVMIRRQPDDTFLGCKVLNIPKSLPRIDKWVKQSREEMIIYRYQEELFRAQINNDIERMGAKFLYYFALLSFLRQMTAHIFLGNRLFRGYWSAENFGAAIKRLTERERSLRSRAQKTTPVLLEELENCRRHLLEKNTPQGQPAKNLSSYIDNMFGRLSSLGATRGEEGLICQICGDLPDEPHTSQCGHAICSQCFEEKYEIACNEKGKDYIDCQICGAKVRSVKSLGRQLKSDGLDDANSHAPSGSKYGKEGTRTVRDFGDDINNLQPLASCDNGFLNLADRDYQGRKASIPESTKVNTAMFYIKKWTKEAPDDKIIVFTQWTYFAKILGRKLHEKDIPFLYYVGSMKMDERNEAIDLFRDDKKPRVLICSFKCGGVSLNLTCANRVILVDLWWNSAMEEQAFGRVRRIGQEKRTHLVRILQRGTIDQRIMNIQAQKEDICGIVMNGDNVKKTKGLDAMQLMSLFGEVVLNKNGTKKVVADYAKLMREPLTNEEYEVPDDAQAGAEAEMGGSGHQDDEDQEVDDENDGDEDAYDENEEHQEGMMVIGEDDDEDGED